MTESQTGLRLETGASILARDMIADYLKTFAHVIQRDRAAGQSASIEFVNGLSGVAALIIAGGHGSRQEVEQQLISKLLEYIARDLRHLRQGV